MALAILRYLGRANGEHEFEADTGTNSFYQYKVGASSNRSNGVSMLDEVSHTSSLVRSPVSDPRNLATRFRFTVSDELFTRDNRFIQLFSYRTAGRMSPAFSEVITIVPSIRDFNGDSKLPKIMTLTHIDGAATKTKVERAPCHIKENTVSEAMFLNALLGALPGLLTTAMPAIGKIIPGLQKALPVVGKLLPELGKIIPSDVKPGKEGVDQVLKNISPETIKAIIEVVQGVSEKSDNSVPAEKSEAKSIARYSHDFSVSPAVLMQLAPLLEKVLSPESIKAIGDNPLKLFKAIADSAVKLEQMGLKEMPVHSPGSSGSKLDKVVQGMALRRRERSSRYSEAKIAPALLAALPALMPLLEKVANPEMIKAIGEQPVKLFDAIANAGLKHQKQELDHLEKINPGVDDPAFDALVATMSTKSTVSVKAKFTDSFSIQFADAKTVKVAGKDKVLYDRRQKMHLPVTLVPKSKGTQKNISKVIFQLIVQDGETMEILAEKKFRVSDVNPGVPVVDIVLGTDDMKKLPANRDLKIEVAAHWKNGDKVEGTFRNHYIMLSDGCVYQRAGKSIKQHFVLNDVSRFRNYWHKVWEGGPETHDRWKIDFECKYYYLVNTRDASIKKLETKKKIVSDSGSSKDESYRRKIMGKVKSGMEVSVSAYNELLLLHQLPTLSAEQLSAFMGQQFTKEASIAARVSVDFKGRRGDTAALWTYPEGNMQSYILGKAVSVDPNGLITALQEEEVFFPRFSSVHFIGTKSE